MEDAFADLKAWYLKQPVFTRSYLAFGLALTLSSTLNLLSPMSYYFTFQTAFLQLNIWRPFTACSFFGKLDFMFIIKMMYCYQAMSKTEKMFNRETYADYLWFQIIIFLALILVSPLFSLYFMADSFMMANMYLWCKRHPHEEIRFYFGIQIKSGYLPFVFLGFNFILGGSIIPLLIGIGLGHLYVFIKDIFPAKYQKDYLATPMFFKKWWYNKTNIPRMPNMNPPRAHFGGTGHRLD